MNPYLAGTLLGLVLLSAMVFSGRGLGASGGIKNCVISVVGAVSDDHVQASPYYSQYFEDGKKPLKSWLKFRNIRCLAGWFYFRSHIRKTWFQSGKISENIRQKTIDFCLSGWIFFCVWRSTGQGLYQRSCPLRNGSAFHRRICNNDRHFWICLFICLVLPEKLGLII